MMKAISLNPTLTGCESLRNNLVGYTVSGIVVLILL